VAVCTTLLAEPVRWLPPAGAQQKEATAPDDPRLSKLPPTHRERGRVLLAQPDGKKGADLGGALAEKDAAPVAEFLLALLETDPSSLVRRAVIDAVGKLSSAPVRQALEHT